MYRTRYDQKDRPYSWDGKKRMRKDSKFCSSSTVKEVLLRRLERDTVFTWEKTHGLHIEIVYI